MERYCPPPTGMNLEFPFLSLQQFNCYGECESLGAIQPWLDLLISGISSPR